MNVAIGLRNPIGSSMLHEDVSAGLNPLLTTVTPVTTHALTITLNERVWVVAEGWETREATICIAYVLISATAVGLTVICLVEAFMVIIE